MAFSGAAFRLNVNRPQEPVNKTKSVGAEESTSTNGLLTLHNKLYAIPGDYFFALACAAKVTFSKPAKRAASNTLITVW